MTRRGADVSTTRDVAAFCENTDGSAFPHPSGSVAYTPKDAVELNAVFARESYRVGLREFFNTHELDAA